MTTVKTGKHGEELAANFLKSLGYKIIDKNFRCRFGEIDLIALDGEVIAFIEVKYRNSAKCGSAEESISNKKLEKIIKTAHFYLSYNKQLNKNLRIDLVAINRTAKMELNLIKNITI